MCIPISEVICSTQCPVSKSSVNNTIFVIRLCSIRGDAHGTSGHDPGHYIMLPIHQCPKESMLGHEFILGLLYASFRAIL